MVYAIVVDNQIDREIIEASLLNYGVIIETFEPHDCDQNILEVEGPDNFCQLLQTEFDNDLLPDWLWSCHSDDGEEEFASYLK